MVSGLDWCGRGVMQNVLLPIDVLHDVLRSPHFKFNDIDCETIRDII